MKFYTIGEELYEDKSKANRFNILSELNIFPTAGNPCIYFFYLFLTPNIIKIIR